jgi:hypothetical protein
VKQPLSGSGDFELLSSSDLRKKLADLKSNQELLMQSEEIQTRFVDQQLRSFLSQSIDRTSIRTTQLPGAQVITTHHSSPFAPSNDELLRNKEFANLLVDLIFFTKRIMLTYDRLEKDLRQIDSLVVSENPFIETKPYVPY